MEPNIVTWPIQLSADLLAASSLVLTALVSAFFVNRRLTEETRRTRISLVEAKNLEALLGTRKAMKERWLEVEELPDVTDNQSAQELYLAVRKLRREIREAVNDLLIFGDEKTALDVDTDFQCADEFYKAFSNGLNSRIVDYKSLNFFKSKCQEIIMKIDDFVFQYQSSIGISKPQARARVASKHQKLIEEINAD
jgi:uncharacterized protein YigA (DUF484 family)